MDMKIVFILLISLLISYGLPTISPAQDKTVKIVSLSWPPFSGPHLPGYGSSLKIIQETFTKAGYQTQIHFYPWKRALSLFQNGHFDIIAPEYYDPLRANECIFSQSFQSSPLGFISQKNNRIDWDTLYDLRPYEIGVVNGYLNAPQFDLLVRRKFLTTSPSVDDMTNILKVGNGRIPMAVIDQNVFNYLLHHDPKGKELIDKVVFQEKIIANKSLHLCFHPNERGKSLKQVFDNALTSPGTSP